jgi:hypothetical protein
MTRAVGKPVTQYTRDGVFIKEYKSIAEAGRTSTVKKIILDLYYLEEIKQLVDLYGNTRKTFRRMVLKNNLKI